MHMACELGCGDIVECLADHPGTFLDVDDINGNTPLHLAAAEGHTMIVKMLVDQYRAFPNPVNEQGLRPINVARNKEIEDFLNHY
mmetsp:Transcript_15035/g.10916  ORF Transcript_15035/g.10916 Transcript_15035/m.10916 type:complete len:85 (-) Transcript_15035:68-322(-)